eukprot:TRINITY_DN1005_c0_g5_i1.p1 TRINITY_DN1005_c0_g5~~TRINITY_DN1005_c0_g5_i1.p1  ORF type:complete len:852 (-),score=339.53 TRINITY_DN1005_c0_g5_i1:414-2969(-)
MRLHEAIKSGNINDVKRFLKTDNVNDRDESSLSQTPLHVACQMASCEIVSLLLKKKADVNLPDRNGWTPFHIAASVGQLEICEMLLGADKIDITILNKDGTSALHYLVRHSVPPSQAGLYNDVLTRYLRNRGDINSQTKHGEAALHQACQRSSVAAVKFLLENHASVNILNKINETALHYAVRTGKKEIIQLLLEHGADVNIKCQQGTALDLSPSPEITAFIKDMVKNSKQGTDGDAQDSNISIYDLTEFKLRVKIVRAQNLMPLSGKDNASSFVQVSYNEDRKTTKIKADTLNPKWDEIFLFDIVDSTPGTLKFSIYNQEGDTPATKDDVLGINTINLSELNIDTSGDGTPLKSWYTLKRIPRKSLNKTQIPKLRLEISYILKTQLDAESSSSSSVRLSSEHTDDSDDHEEVIQSSTSSPSSLQRTNTGSSLSSSSSSAASASAAGSIFGWRRGKCKLDGCDCDTYQPEGPRGGPCQNCGHYPAQHENLGKDPTADPAASSSSLTSSSSSAGGPSASSSSSPGPSAPVEVDPTENISELAQRFSSSTAHLLKSSWEIDANDLKLIDKLGQGTSAVVYRGTYRGQEVAIKVLKEKAEAKLLEEFEKEFSIISTLRSPHVVFLYGATLHPNQSIVLEFCQKGSLYDCLLNPAEDITWARVLRAASDSIRGISCLHNWKPQIVHRDLKSLNLLVDQNWVVKVSDFGTARFTSGGGDMATLTRLRGTYAYCAPEVYFGQHFTTKSDIFSFGIILWELAYRCLTGTYSQPYSEYTHIVFDFQIIIQTAKNALRPTIPAGCPEPYADVIRRCWDPAPENRPDTDEVVQLVKDLEVAYESNRSSWDSLRKHPPPPSS